MKDEAKTNSKLGVWLVYRCKGSQQTNTAFMSGIQATRIARRLHQTHRIDYLRIQGVYEDENNKKIDIKAPKVTIIHRKEVEKPTKYDLLSLRLGGEISNQRGIREAFTRMSFYAERLDQDVFVFCPTTGILGKLEMPALPIGLSFDHPLSIPSNCLAVLKADREARRDEKIFKLRRLQIDSQTYAGMILSLLGARGKNLIKTEDDSTATERNMVLQNAGIGMLRNLCETIERFWNNPNVWNKMPRLSLEWKTHSQRMTHEGISNIQQTLQNYEKIIYATQEPLSLTPEEQARFFTAQRKRQEWIAAGRPPSHIRIYSASAVQANKVKESKKDARSLFDTLKGSMSIALRSVINRMITNLMILPQSEKNRGASLVRRAFIGTVYQNPAAELADLIEGASTDKILEDLGSFSHEISPKPYKSISEILEAKRERNARKQQQTQEGDNNE